jgi:hypothetical protein
MFHNLLLSAFPSLINEVPLRNALISQFSELGGNTKGSLATFSDPQNRDVLNQIKFLHRAVSLLQACFFVAFSMLLFVAHQVCTTQPKAIANAPPFRQHCYCFGCRYLTMHAASVARTGVELGSCSAA